VLTGVQSKLGTSLGANPQTVAMLSYVEALDKKTALPDLTTVMDSRTQPAVVGPRATVREVVHLMHERRTTAVCIMEPTTTPGTHPKIAGIFTSKDIVLHIIAAGLDANMCSVVWVMTPHPDTAPIMAEKRMALDLLEGYCTVTLCERPSPLNYSACAHHPGLLSY